MARVHLRKGETYISEGEISGPIALVQSGRLVAWTSQNTKRYILAELGRGDVIGELSFFDKKPRSASVTALTDCELVEFEMTGIDLENPQVPDAKSIKTITFLIGHLVRRLRKSNQEVVSLKASLQFLRKHQSASSQALMMRKSQCLARALWLIEHHPRMAEGVSVEDFSRVCDDVIKESGLCESGLSLMGLPDVLVEFAVVEVDKERQFARLNRARLEELMAGIIKSDRYLDLPNPPVEATEVLTFFLRNRSKLESIASEGEFVCAEVFADVDDSVREEYHRGLEVLHEVGWIVLQADRSIFRASIPDLLAFNHALQFRHAFDRGRVLASSTVGLL